MAEVFINWGDSSGQTITLTGSTVPISHTYAGMTGYVIDLSGRTTVITGMTLSGSNITELSGFSDTRVNISSLNLNSNKFTVLPSVNNKLKHLYLNNSISGITSSVPNYNSTMLETLHINNNNLNNYSALTLPNTMHNFSANDNPLNMSSVHRIVNDMYTNSSPKAGMNISLINTAEPLTGTTQKYDLIDNSGATVKTTGRFVSQIHRPTQQMADYPFQLEFNKPTDSTNDINIHVNWGDGNTYDVVFPKTNNYMILSKVYPSGATIYTVQVDAHFDDITTITPRYGFYPSSTINTKEFIGLKNLNLYNNYPYYSYYFYAGSYGNWYTGVLDLSRNNKLEQMNLIYGSFTNIIYPKTLTYLNRIETDSCTGMIIPRIDLMPSLSYIAMQSCNLSGSLPSYFSSKSLTYVRMRYNYSLTGAIPDMTSNTGLTDISLENCSFNSIGATNWDTLPSLQKFWLNSNNQLSGVTPVLSASTDLREYQISNCKFYGTLPDFKLFPNITQVDTSYNNKSDSPGCGITGPFPDLSVNTKLTNLNLSWDNLNNDTNFDYLQYNSRYNVIINSIVVEPFSGKTYVGGAFNTFSGTSQNYLIRLNEDGTKDTSFNIGTGFNGVVNSVVVEPFSGKTYVGGNFTQYKGLSQYYLIRLNQDGTKDSSFDIGSGFNNQVRSIKIDSNGKIYVGGDFSQFRSSSQNYFIRLNENGTKDTTFAVYQTGINSYVSSITIDSSGRSYVGGSFGQYQGVNIGRLIRFDSGGTRDTSFDMSIGFNDRVNCIELDSNGKIYVGGWFTSFSGTSQNYLIRLNENGTKDTSFDVNKFLSTNRSYYDGIYCLMVNNDKIYLGGRFGSYNGSEENNFIVLDSGGTKDSSFDIGKGFTPILYNSNYGVINSIAKDTSGRTYLGGEFNVFNRKSHRSFVRLDSGGTFDNSYKYFRKIDSLDLSNNTGLTYLYLNSCNITDYHNSITGLTKLNNLSLDYNPLTTFPDLSNCTGLTDLRMNYCSVYDYNSSFTGLTRLQYLYLNGNPFTTFPDFSKSFRLNTIEMSYCNIDKNLPLSLSACTSDLYSISMYNNKNPLTNSGITGTFPTFFSGLTRLQTINLSTNNMSGALPQNVFNYMPSLSTFNISSNYFTSGVTSLSANTNLSQLALSNNNFSGETIFDMTNFNNINSLNLSSCNLGGDLKLSPNATIYQSQIGGNNFTGVLPQITNGMGYFSAYNNQFTGYTSSTRRPTDSSLYNFDASYNYINSDDINKILFDISGCTRSSSYVSLYGPNMGIPYGKGLLAMDYMRSTRSWSFSVNYLYVHSGDTNSVDPTYYCTDFIYDGGDNTTATINASGSSYVIARSGSSFVWDLGGIGQYSFTDYVYPNSVTRNLNGTNFTITYDSGYPGSYFIKIRKTP